MIIDPTHFSNKIDKILNILYQEDLEVIELNKMLFKNFQKEKITEHYNQTFHNFPVVIENASSEIGISIFAVELTDLYYELDCHSAISSEKENEILYKRKKFEPKNHIDTIEIFIDEYFHSLIYSYDKVLQNTKKQHYFTGIEEEKILLSLLNRYRTILDDKNKQIDIFWSIKLTKELSDKILEMIIEFIEQRLNLLCVSVDKFDFKGETTFVENKIQKLEWKGSQQQLCELIIELEEKKWIGEIKNGERLQIAKSITTIFDLQQTRKNKNSNTSKSFYQIFKGEFEQNKRFYPFLERNNYSRNFNSIIKNNS